MSIIKSTWIFIIFFLVVPGKTGNTDRSHLPHRDALATDVEFWKIVFAELSLDQYLIHDSQDLSIIYKTVTFDSSVSVRKREKELKKVKDEIKELLLKFHSGAFEKSRLPPRERAVYDQFGSDRRNDKFLIASKRVRAQQGIKENFLAGVKRSFAYLPYIEKVLKQEGIPTELKYLPHVESSFNPSAVSHVGAAGMWQFMKRTGRLYMKVNRIKDERFDPLTSTKAAARLLKYNYRILQDWALAITAYNHGLGGMKRAKRTYRNYLTIREKYLRRSFGFASKNFYPELLAVVEIADSIDYYFPNLEKDPLVVFQEIELPVAISLPRFVQKFHIDRTILAELNPGFRKHVWNGSARVPAGYTLQEQLIITSIKDFQLQREALKQSVAANQIGVESVFRHKYKVNLGDELFTLVEDVSSSTIIEPGFAALTLAEKSLSGGKQFARPGVEIAPDINIAAITIAANAGEDSELTLTAPNRITAYEIEIPGEIVAMLPLQGFSKPSVDIPYSAAEIERKAFDYPTGEEAETATALVLFEEALWAVTVMESGVGISSIKHTVEPDISSGMKKKRSINLTDQVLFTPDSLAGRSFAIEQEEVDILLPPALLPKPAVPVEIAEKSYAVRNDFAYQVDVVLPLTSPPVVASEEYILAEAVLWHRINFANAEKYNLLISSEDSLFFVALNNQSKENWLAALKPHVEQILPKYSAPVFVEQPAYSNVEDEQGALPYTASISFNKQSVEIDVAHQIAYKIQWSTAAATKDEFSLQEIVVLLRRQLNPEQQIILVYPQETLGHFSEWLNISVHQLRRYNNLSRSQKIYTGQRLKLDFSRVTPAEFAKKRLSYHLNLILEQLKGSNRVRVMDYTVNSGENLWTLAHKRYNFPVNLLLYFNDFDKLERLYPGDVIKLPVIYN
jgi:LysM repeat protein